MIDVRTYHVATYQAGHGGYYRPLRPDHWEVRHDSKRYIYERPRYNGRPINALRGLWRAGASISEMGRRFSVNPGSVRNRMRKLGIPILSRRQRRDLWAKP